MTAPWELFIGCAPGLEPMLAGEVEAVLSRAPRSVPGGVELRGGLEDVARLNVRLGVAIQVLVRLADFEARHFSKLERGLRAVPWDQWLRPGAPLTIKVTTRRSKLYHSKAIEERARRFVQEALRGDCPPGEDKGAAQLRIRMDDNRCTVSLDSSGAPLHRRGYRLASAKAPLREDLARAVVKLSGWDPKTPFADPFCGSGTLGIEAAMLARGLAPGRNRGFAFEAWPCFEAEVLARARADAASAALERAPGPIFVSDRDAGAVGAVADNAARAEVLDDLRIEEAAMGRAPFLGAGLEAGAWVSNPPHGQRIGKGPGLKKLYQSVGKRFEGLDAGWSLTLVVRDRRLAYAAGVPLESRLMTEHGGSKIWVLGATTEKK